MPGCRAEHQLVDMWESIHDGMEGGGRAAVQLRVDYEKAFNCMDHLVCLKQLEKLGANPGTISLVRAFLEERVMTITIGDHTAAPVKISRGSPQGSVLGCLLYCVKTQLITKNIRASAVQL